MQEMLQYVKQHQWKHRTDTVDNVTSYMFQATNNPKNEDEKPKTVVYMKSWFLQV